LTIPSNLRDHPLFICGHPKAGTSLLRAVLDSHPQLVVYPEETVFFRHYLPQSSGLDLQDQLELAERSLIHIFTWNREKPAPSQAGFPDRDYSSISFEEVNQVMRQLVGDQCRHPGDMLSAAVLAYGQVRGQVNDSTRYWVEKSPYNEYFAGQIFTWWPEARCIHILRDPRDNFVSYRRKHSRWEAEFFAANWNRSTRAGMQNQERFSSQRYLILRYEDLAQSPQATLKQLVDFLQIAWDASLSAPTRAGEQWQGNSMFSSQFQAISAAPVGRWNDSLAPSDAAVIELMTRPLLEAWQYPQSQGSTPLSARWRAASWPIRRRLTGR
jgi:hypothetical protein